ncbi:hypothetical protein ETAA8_47740 [Anatilimnocola aggregata]|uniref:GTPase-associated protein 1 N-terminal domain-containing protein n=1 Tax=Anatilimnocola aggregata TaxID=2528021 RepID=A0A517YHG7_9BACT|nr:hypothetical protein [Anatilimnocola aggregata]QDU29659.1 hypothetical protein ETAA8_47740 [Anatilimnocola aggregata]
MTFRVEQAIFTSLRGERMAGYQLASRSSGIDDDLAQQLSNWGPAHDSLETRLGRTSVNVHPLEGELVCIGYTQLAGSEYSGRAGGRVYTHSFILPHEALEPFQFNPFTILRAFRSAGRTQPRREPPESLDTFSLVGRSSSNSGDGKQVLTATLDDSVCEKLLWALAAGQPVFLAGDAPLDSLMEATLQLLPAEDRPGVSLSTGLRISPRRPFQLQAIAADAVLVRQLQRNEHAVVIQVPGNNSSPARDTKTSTGTKFF